MEFQNNLLVGRIKNPSLNSVNCNWKSAKLNPHKHSKLDCKSMTYWCGLQIRGVRKKLKNVQIGDADFAILAEN